MSLLIGLGVGQSGASGAPITSFRSGLYYTTPGAGVVGSVGFSVNDTILIPFPVGRAATFNAIGVHTSAAGTATAVARLGIWTDNGSAYPDALVLDAGTVAVDTAAADKEIAISQLLAPGLYWLSCSLQVATPPAMYAFAGGNGGGPPHVGFPTIVGIATSTTGLRKASGPTGALPATFPSGATTTTGLVVALKAA